MSIKNIEDFNKYFYDENSCVEYIKNIRFKNSIYCPNCSSEKIYIYNNNRLYKCSECNKQFTITVGTIFESSKISLKKWLLAIFLLWSNKDGISINEFSSILSVTKKTAKFMYDRIIEAYYINYNKYGGD